MRPSRVRQRWNEGKPALATVAQLTDPATSELISLFGFDCIWMDFEHQPTGLMAAAQMIRASRVGSADVMARPGKGEFPQIMRLLEAGAHGIMYPRCESVEEAQEVVRWAKFAPLGLRGYYGSNADAMYGTFAAADYVADANRETWLVVQIESPDAAKQARQIAEVEGVDGLFFGPGDYSLLSGQPGQVQGPEVTKAMEGVCRDARAAGKRFGTLCFDVPHVRRVIDIGGELICYGSDLAWVMQGYRKMQSEFALLGFDFDNRTGVGQSVYAPAVQR